MFQLSEPWLGEATASGGLQGFSMVPKYISVISTISSPHISRLNLAVLLEDVGERLGLMPKKGAKT